MDLGKLTPKTAFLFGVLGLCNAPAFAQQTPAISDNAKLGYVEAELPKGGAIDTQCAAKNFLGSDRVWCWKNTYDANFKLITNPRHAQPGKIWIKKTEEMLLAELAAAQQGAGNSVQAVDGDLRSSLAQAKNFENENTRLQGVITELESTLKLERENFNTLLSTERSADQMQRDNLMGVIETQQEELATAAADLKDAQALLQGTAAQELAAQLAEKEKELAISKGETLKSQEDAEQLRKDKQLWILLFAGASIIAGIALAMVVISVVKKRSTDPKPVREPKPKGPGMGVRAKAIASRIGFYKAKPVVKNEGTVYASEGDVVETASPPLADASIDDNIPTVRETEPADNSQVPHAAAENQSEPMPNPGRLFEESENVAGNEPPVPPPALQEVKSVAGADGFIDGKLRVVLDGRYLSDQTDKSLTFDLRYSSEVVQVKYPGGQFGDYSQIQLAESIMDSSGYQLEQGFGFSSKPTQNEGDGWQTKIFRKDLPSAEHFKTKAKNR